MLSNPGSGRERIAAMFSVALVHGLLLWALLASLGARVVAPDASTLRLFDIGDPRPPPVIEELQRTGAGAPEDAPAPPNLRANPASVMAPTPEIRPERPPAVPAAPVAGSETAASAGASDRAGPGTGAGDSGAGAGAGAGGTGIGATIPARQITGRIRNRDYPVAAWRAGIEGRVLVRFAVDPSGRASGCLVLRSSGNADLDTVTCRLIERRFRFAPARDAGGRAVPDTKIWEQIWWLVGRENGP